MQQKEARRPLEKHRVRSPQDLGWGRSDNTSNRCHQPTHDAPLARGLINVYGVRGDTASARTNIPVYQEITYLVRMG